MNSRRAWIVFAVAVVAYVVAVLQRTSLGVAGVDASERFGATATLLSSITVAQLVVYAGMQIPVGVLLDRFGSRTLMLTGAVLMATGQLVLALAPDVLTAAAGRVLVGAGDAFTFISVIRLLPAWFGGRTLPQLSQWVGTLGTFGQILSAVPFAALLHAAGWTPAFSVAAGLSAVAVVLVALLVADTPDGSARGATPSGWRTTVGEALARPGTRLGFWSHFVTQSPGTMFSLLWGVPFLSIGLGYGSSGAASMLVVMIGAGILIGPVLGVLVARHPMRRSNIVIALVVGMAAAWTLVLAWPGQPPVWAVVLMLIAIGIGGPGSMIGFDFARTFNPLRQLGSANGIVNVAGFTACFTMMLLVGVVLDALDRAAGGTGAPSELYALDRFRIALLVQYLVVGVGVVFLVRARRSTRRRMLEDEGITVAPLWVALSRRWRRKGR